MLDLMMKLIHRSSDGVQCDIMSNWENLCMMMMMMMMVIVMVMMMVVRITRLHKVVVDFTRELFCC